MRWTFQLICFNETVGMKAAKFSFRLAKGTHEKRFHITMDVNEPRRKLREGRAQMDGQAGGRRGACRLEWAYKRLCGVGEESSDDPADPYVSDGGISNTRNSRGRRVGSACKNTVCPFREPKLSAQHPHGSVTVRLQSKQI